MTFLNPYRNTFPRAIHPRPKLPQAIPSNTPRISASGHAFGPQQQQLIAMMHGVAGFRRSA